MSSEPSFPQEMIDAIIEHLSGRCDRLTLASCALASKSLSTPARRRLFSVVELGTSFTSPQEALRRLGSMAGFLSDENSDIASHIRHLKVEISADEVLDSASALNVVLKHVIGRASNLITFSFGGSWLYVIPWTQIQPDVAQLLARLFKQEHIQKFRLAYLSQVPTTLITDRRSIQFLEITHASFATTSTREVAERTQIEHLDIFPNMAEVCLSLATAISLTKRLDTYLGCKEDVFAFLDIVRCLPGPLSSVSLLLSDYDTFLDDSLATMPHPSPVLSVREVTFVCGPAAFDELPPLRPIVSFLEHAIDPLKVETLTIRFLAATQGRFLARFLPSEDAGLQCLGRGIIQNSFPKLRQILFELFVSVQAKENDTYLTSMFMNNNYGIRSTEAAFKSDLALLFIPAGIACASDVARIVARIRTAVQLTISRLR